MSHRIEKDSLGEVPVPSEAYYGAQTQRAVDNFPISGIGFNRGFIYALGLIKRSAAQANMELDLLDKERGGAVVAAAQEVMDGKLDAHFPIDIFQTGSGTSSNMNSNEVISNRGIELLGGTIGSKDPVHPNDHVNMGQSSNDVIPTAIHIAGARAIQNELIPALHHLHEALEAKAQAWDHIIKSGRTHLMDATPVRLGQEFGGYAAQVAHGIRRAELARDALLELALVGNAVAGTGIHVAGVDVHHAVEVEVGPTHRHPGGGVFQLHPGSYLGEFAAVITIEAVAAIVVGDIEVLVTIVVVVLPRRGE